MRHVVSSLVVAAALAAAAPWAASAQSIVDLSKPQTGKSRFVLNADLTPADLGAAEQEKAVPVAVVSRVPACGEGCKMQQPDVPKASRAAFRSLPGLSPFDQDEVRAHITENALKIHNATKNERRTVRRRR